MQPRKNGALSDGNTTICKTQQELWSLNKTDKPMDSKYKNTKIVKLYTILAWVIIDVKLYQCYLDFIKNCLLPI